MKVTVSQPFERRFSDGSQSFSTLLVRFDNYKYESWPLLQYLWSGMPNADGWPVSFQDSKKREALLAKHRENSCEVKFFHCSELEAQVPTAQVEELIKAIRLEAKKHLAKPLPA